MKAKLFGLFLICLILTAACVGNTTPENGEESSRIQLEAIPKNIDVLTAAAMLEDEDVVLIDVREQWEYDGQHIAGSMLIPMSELETRLADIPTDKTVILSCRSGNRSGKVYTYLEERGFENTINMEGGIIAWEAAGLPVVE